jgi:glutaminase
MATDGGRRLPAVWTRLASAFFEWNHSMTAAPGSSPIQALLDSLHARYAGFRDGEVAAYIPELAKADPDLFGICLATADGFVYESGDSRHEFTIQSISKPFVYGLALDGDPTDAVDVYFQQCSISVRCVDLALMGATLANQGMNPVTGERAIEDEHVENVLSVMASCGMYNFSGG